MSFHTIARKVRRHDIPFNFRRNAFRSCVAKYHWLARQGFQRTYERYSQHFGFDVEVPDAARRLTLAMDALETERRLFQNKLQTFARKRIRAKLRGEGPLPKAAIEALYNGDWIRPFDTPLPPQAEARVNPLENWIETLVATPIAAINQKYPEYESEQSIRTELESLPLPRTGGILGTETVASSHVSPFVLEQLHYQIRLQPCEDDIWRAVVWYLAHPLPLSIAHDLIDRGIAISALGFTRQVDEVQWRLATLDQDALYTLITERYEQSHHSLAQFETMMQLYKARGHDVLHMLSYRTPSSPEKHAAYLAAVSQEEERLKELAEDKTL